MASQQLHAKVEGQAVDSTHAKPAHSAPHPHMRGSAACVHLTPYAGEAQLPIIASLIERELSEPYIVHTYRYFLRGWPHHTFIAWAKDEPASAPSSLGPRAHQLGLDATTDQDETSSTGSSALSDHESDDEPGALSISKSIPVGVIVSKLEAHRGKHQRGYIAMLSVAPEWRGRGVATRLVQRGVRALVEGGAQEIVLETEADNVASLALYESFGFVREKRLFRFYLNGKDCFRLVLPVTHSSSPSGVAASGTEHKRPSSPPARFETLGIA
ncbi:N-acetyltransferase [Ceraceosorus bombacis]|uniref:N-acetyltransferase n=1 Tax=Ceraceosorus bombacis TaxID=401625 RepID=A0A0P1BE48_9BASI|nr:N-acetyltransferase [Ceraceosorus bombacis]